MENNNSSHTLQWSHLEHAMQQMHDRQQRHIDTDSSSLSEGESSDYGKESGMSSILFYSL
jgi:hypothetical protein